MANPLDTEDPGLFSSILDWISTPGYAVRNVLRGDLKAAGKNLLDFGGDVIDAALPGDWIGHLSTPQDKPQTSDLLGGMEDGWGKFGVNLIGDTLTDPLTYIPGALVAKGLGKVGEGIGGVVKGIDKVIPGTEKAAQLAKLKAKSTFGYLEPKSSEAAAALDEADAAQSMYGKASLKGAETALKGLDEESAKQLSAVISNTVKETPSGFNAMMGPMYRPLLEGSETLDPRMELARELSARNAPTDVSHLGDIETLSPSVLSEAEIFKQVDPLSHQLGVLTDLPGAAKTLESFPERTFKPRTVTKVDPLSESLGVRGVADPGAISMGVPGDMSGGLSFVHQMGKEAAENTLDAFPQTLNKPVVDYLGNRVGIDRTALNEGAERIARQPRSPVTERRVVDPLTGQVTIKPITPRDAPDLIPESNQSALSSLMGGNQTPLVAGDLTRKTKPMIKLEDQLRQWNSRIDALPTDHLVSKDEWKLFRNGETPEPVLEEIRNRAERHKDNLKKYAARYLNFAHNNFLEKTKDLGALKAGIGDDVTTMIPQDYAHRMFSGLEDADSIALKGGNPNSLKGRTLKENEQFRDFMNENRGKGIEHEEDLVKSTLHLAGQEGRIAQRSAIAKSLLGDEFTALNDADIGGKIADKIKAMEGIDPEGAYLVKQAWEGLPERGLLTKALHAANTIFKPAAVAGIGIPRVGGITKNIISFPMQLAAEGEGKQALRQLGRTPATLAEAARKTVQGYGGDLPATAVGKELDIADAALAAGGGRAKNVLESLEQAGHPELADALKYGVLDGFVSGEGITNSLRNSSGMQKIAGKLGASEKTKERVGKALEAPMQGFQGAEQSARYANFKEMRADLIAKGVPRDEASKQAAKRIGSALYDYGVKTAENRALRDVIPFGAYQTNAVRQSAKALTNNPWAAVMAAEVLGPDSGNQDPLYPYMEGRTNIPLGMDDKGNQNYLTNLGIPLESLNILPNPSANLLDFGRDIERDIIGSSQPLLKSAFGVVSGEDPFFESPYGTYSKVAGQDLGDAGRAFNMAAGTGLLQPVTSQIGQFQKFFDDKGTALSDTADFLTGANSVSVDEDRALMQQTQEWLKRNPDVQQATTFYQQTKDPQAQAMIQAMREAKKRIKEKKQAAGAP